ncbi:hypothetical protein SAMN05444487_11525 [Marininema mesophilum]|uniref:YfhE-like protein n=1 Tax=Marininema mesophilum TaxID=1048340 RepID=A0A1H3B3E3_9BACL|nr:hypothetical protein [Marininema mesophilum]SDX36452.1 hypothetical protein SAMN05444487_11525 [Marininema mesophilum]
MAEQDRKQKDKKEVNRNIQFAYEQSGELTKESKEERDSEQEQDTKACRDQD